MRPSGIDPVRGDPLGPDGRVELETLHAFGGWQRLMLTASVHDLRGAVGQINAAVAHLAAADRMQQAAAGTDDAGTDTDVTHMRQQAIGHITAATRALSARIRDVEELGRQTSVDALFEPVPTDVGQLVHRVTTAVDAGGRTVHVRTDPVTAVIDPDRVEQIVDNLVRNAVDHTPDSSTVWVRAEADGDDVVIVVEDSGPGMGPGARGLPPLPRPGGTTGPGVGLGIVVAFTNLHGGTVRTGDRVGGGAAVHVRLPGRVDPR